MALVLNEEQVMLKESAAGFLSEKASVAHLRALRDAGDEQGFSDDVWREMVQMGWAGIAIPEEFGGLGYGYTGLGLVLEQAGRNLSASPLQSSVLVAATVIAELGTQQQKEQLLPAIAPGDKLVSLALQEGPHHAPQQTAMTATLDGDGYLLNGCKVLVLDASSAEAFIVVARTAGGAGDTHGISAFLVDAGAEGVAVNARVMVDSRNAGEVTLSNTRVSAENLLGSAGDAWTGLSRALDIVNIGLVLGCTAMLRPIQLRSATLRREMPALLAVSLLTVSLFLDTFLSRIDGFVMLSGLVIPATNAALTTWSVLKPGTKRTMAPIIMPSLSSRNRYTVASAGPRLASPMLVRK